MLWGNPLKSIDTELTITKVRVGSSESEEFIVASSYEGRVVAYDLNGNHRWSLPLSGYMNHDLWCEDLSGDGVDDVLAANADGSLYCIDGVTGRLLWSFHPSDAPMSSVCVLTSEYGKWIACGGYDKNLYYLNPSGELLKTIASATYSQEHTWDYSMTVPHDREHTINFLRPARMSDGREVLVLHGVCHTMAVLARGSLYCFEALADLPYQSIELVEGRPMGEMRVGDTDQDGNDEIFLGGSGLRDAHNLLHVDLVTEQQNLMDVMSIEGDIESFGYRVVQPEWIGTEEGGRYIILFGSRILLVPPSLDPVESEVLTCRYSFNDVWKAPGAGLLILASAQSGGSCIHILDLKDPDWRIAYESVQPPGKIATILRNTENTRLQLSKYQKPEWQRASKKVFLMTESIPDALYPLVERIRNGEDNPVFYNNTSVNGAEAWDRSSMTNERYRERRDTRRKYVLTQPEILEHFDQSYKTAVCGLTYWGGHGNDPYMFQLETWKKVLENNHGKKTVMIFPELEDHSDFFSEVMDDYFYPLAEYCRSHDSKLYIRCKHTFWQANVYLPMWDRLRSGEFSDVFIPSMEETTDKSMELSLASRLGIWASGAVDSWGSRCARDNPSFDRLRQFSHQMLPSHFLRMMVFHISYGAQYINNFPVDQHYMSLLWELIEKGVIYVPDRSEILSFSPVHLSMLNPDETWIEESSNVKWTTFFDAEKEPEQKEVFGRLSGTWPGAPVNEWDFSKYAAGIDDRRLHFLAPYPHGMVLITPSQGDGQNVEGIQRGRLRDHLHPIYKDILDEYCTDGVRYLNPDGSVISDASSYAPKIQSRIKQRSADLPLQVGGEVAWVVAQCAPKHLRLTLIDSGYINPKERQAIIRFQHIKPIRVTDLLSGEVFLPGSFAEDTLKLIVPCGLFRFLDIELESTL